MANILQLFGELVSPNDPELVEKTLARINEQDKWNDVFSKKLIELLDNIDHLKAEIRERMRLAEVNGNTACASLERAEHAHKAAAEHTLEAERLLEVEIRKGAQLAEATISAARASLEQAQRAHNEANEQVLEARRFLDGASRQVEHAQQRAVDAISRLRDAEEKLALADRKLTESRESERAAVKRSKAVMRWSLVATALSWSGTIWLAWVTLRPTFPLYGAIAVSTLIVIGLILIPQYAENI